MGVFLGLVVFRFFGEILKWGGLLLGVGVFAALACALVQHIVPRRTGEDAGILMGMVTFVGMLIVRCINEIRIRRWRRFAKEMKGDNGDE